MQAPMVGTWTIEVHAVQMVSIHGDLYFDVRATRTDDPSATQLSIRIPRHTAAAPPAPGQRLVLTFLMGQVTRAEVAPV